MDGEEAKFTVVRGPTPICFTFMFIVFCYFVTLRLDFFLTKKKVARQSRGFER